MSSETAICNRALAFIGHSSAIANLEENSNAARRCKAAYGINRDMLLEKRSWTFTRRFVTLALNGTAPSYWDYSYAYPSDCSRIDWLFDAGFDRQRDSRVPYEVALAADGATRLIYTSLKNAELRYRAKVTNADLFPPLFQTALAYMVAAEIAYPLTNDAGIRQEMMEMSAVAYGKASEADGNENEEIYDQWQAEWIEARS